MPVVTIDDAQAYAQIQDGVDDALVQSVIDAAETWVEATIGRKLLRQEIVEYLDGGEEYLLPSWASIASISEVYDTVAAEAVDADDYDFDPDEPSVYKVSSGQGPYGAWAAGRRRWKVTHTAGLAALAADVPGSIALAVKMLVKRWYDRRGDETRQTAVGMTLVWGALADGDIAVLLRPYTTLRL